MLIALDQRMQEIAHTKTDAQGHFSIDAPDPGMHLIRVDHQGAAYFQPAPPNTPNVNVQVFDVAAVVAGVSTVANVMRVETDPQGLRVTQSFFIKNDSNPPRTQFSNRSYDFYLPPDAQIEGSAAMAPGGMPVQSSPVPLGDKGHYAFLFPLRPGVTQFQLSYHLPYSGSLAFDQRFATPTDSFVVMMPKSMSFKPGGGVSFESLNETPGALTMLARNGTPSRPSPSRSPARAPCHAIRRRRARPMTAEGRRMPAAMRQRMTPGPAAALACPSIRLILSTNTSGGSWAAITLVFAVGAGFLLRRPAGRCSRGVAAAPVCRGSGAGRPSGCAQRRAVLAGDGPSSRQTFRLRVRTAEAGAGTGFTPRFEPKPA